MAQNDNASRQPAKQRKAQAHAPQHRRREMMSAHLSEDLMLEYERRSIALRTGDQVQIMRGDFAGHQGEILEIDYKNQEIEVDGAVNRSSDGSQVARPIHPSNVRITELDLTDPRRRAKIERKGVTVEEPEPEPEPEPEETDEEEADEAEEPEPVEPAEGAKGPDVAPPPEPEPEPELEPEAEEPEADEAEPETPEEDAEPTEDEEPAPEGDTEEAEDEAEQPAEEPPEEQAPEDEEPTEADEADATEDTDEDTDEEGSA